MMSNAQDAYAINNEGAVLDSSAVAVGITVKAEATGKIDGNDLKSTCQDSDLPSLEHQVEGEWEGSVTCWREWFVHGRRIYCGQVQHRSEGEKPGGRCVGRGCTPHLLWTRASTA